MTPEQIFLNNEQWLKRKQLVDNDYLVQLSDEQDPDILYIGCSDSRVIPEAFMDVGPGEVLVHRNIGNLVSPFDANTRSVIIHSVENLNVAHIVVCGHYDCGAAKIVCSSDTLGSLAEWLQSVEKVYQLNETELKSIPDNGDRCNRLVELNVYAQCDNVRNFLEVYEANITSRIQIHGWVFDVHSGRIVDLNINSNR